MNPLRHCRYFSTGILWLLQQVDAAGETGRLDAPSEDRSLPTRLSAWGGSTGGKFALIRRATTPFTGGGSVSLAIADQEELHHHGLDLPPQAPVRGHFHHLAGARLLEDGSTWPLQAGSFLPRSQGSSLLDHGSFADPAKPEEKGEKEEEGAIKLLIAEKSERAKEGTALSFLLVAFAVFFSCAIYFLNHPDEHLYRVSWSTLSTLIGMFLGLLEHYVTREMLWGIGIEPEFDKSVHGNADLLWGTFFDFTIYYLISVYVLWSYKSNLRLLDALGTVFSLIIALHFSNFATNLQESPLFAKSPFTKMSVLPLMIFWTILFRMWGHYRRAKHRHGREPEHDADQEAVHAWEHECEHIEDEIVALTCGLLISQCCRFAITGDFPPAQGYKKVVLYPISYMVNLSGCGFGFGFAAVVVGAIKDRQEHTDNFKAMMRTIQKTMSMTMAWCLLFSLSWACWYVSEVRGSISPGDKILQLISCALINTTLSFIGILLCGKLIIHHGPVHDGFLFLVGMGWEKVYLQAIYSIPTSDLGFAGRVVTWAIAYAVMLVIFPTWIYVIHPKAYALAHGSKRVVEADEKWLEDRWLPFVHELRSELRKVEARVAEGYAEVDRLPSQAQFLTWGHKAIELSEEVRGVGNGTPNVVYQVLMRMSQHNAPYRFADVPCEWSKDGFIRVIDGTTRASFYVKKEKGERRTINEEGNLRQSVHESGIANTQLSNIMNKRSATLLIVGSVLREIMLRIVKKRQAAALVAFIKITEGTEQELLKRMSQGDTNLAPADIEKARTLFQRILNEPNEQSIAKLGIDSSTPAGKAFMLRGVPVRSFGQLAPETKVNVQKMTEKIVDEGMPITDDAIDQELEEFIAFLRNNPGSVWKDDGKQHMHLLLKAKVSSQVSFVSQARIAGQTSLRFLPIRWVRTVDLLEGQVDGGAPVIKRTAGQKEISRLRHNTFGYDDDHGLGLCSPAFAIEDVLDVTAAGRKSTGAIQFGTTFVTDKSAKLGNWFMTDIDKIVNEFALMNVRGWDGNADEFLPGEAPIMVGQNPRVASSIGVTQHTQMCTGSVGKWPVLRLRAPGLLANKRSFKLAEEVEAQVELVQVGNNEDSVILRVEVAERAHAAHPCIVKLLYGARKKLLNVFGGRQVDFNVFAAANVHTPGAVVTLTPLSNVVRSVDDEGVYINPDTQERSDKDQLSLGNWQLPVSAVSFAEGKGNWMIWDKDAWGISVNEGRNILGCLFDFTRKPGVRQILVAHLQESINGWQDVLGAAELDENTTTHVDADSFWDERTQANEDGGHVQPTRETNEVGGQSQDKEEPKQDEGEADGGLNDI